MYLNNYQLISILPVFSKILEKVIHKKTLVTLWFPICIAKYYSTTDAILNFINNTSITHEVGEYCFNMFRRQDF